MKLSEIKGERALDVLADLIDPMVSLGKDKKFIELLDSNMSEAMKLALHDHKAEVIQMMAVLDGEDPATYAESINVMTLPIKLVEMFTDEALVSLFTSQGQTMEKTSSGSVTANTEVSGQ